VEEDFPVTEGRLMPTESDLRRAPRGETEGLDAPIEPVDIERRAQRRRLGQTAAVAATVVLVFALGVAVGSATGGGPRPAATPSVPSVGLRIDPNLPPSGAVIRTGALVDGDEELVVWFDRDGGFLSGLLNRTTGVVRDLDTLTTGGTGFAGLAQVDDGAGNVIDYGLFIGDAADIEGQVHGGTFPTHLAHWSNDPTRVVFWAVHRATPVPADPGHVVDAGADQPVFTAYAAGHRPLGSSAGKQSLRTDEGVVRQDAPRVGDVVDTGATLADGRTLLLWFTGAGDQAELVAGARDATGGVTRVKDLGGFHQPPYASGFSRGWDTFDGPAGTQILLGFYVGPAATITMTVPGQGVTTGTARWSAHPELWFSWATGTTAATRQQVLATALDAAGNPIATRRWPD
jgi:hypothetical protein